MDSKNFRDYMPLQENDPGVICKPFYEFPGMDSLQGFDTMSKAVLAMKCAIIDIVCKGCGVDPAPYLNEASSIRFNGIARCPWRRRWGRGGAMRRTGWAFVRQWTCAGAWTGNLRRS